MFVKNYQISLKGDRERAPLGEDGEGRAGVAGRGEVRGERQQGAPPLQHALRGQEEEDEEMTI